MLRRVGFSSSGLAPSVCAGLLCKAGTEVVLNEPASPSTRIVVLPETTVALLSELLDTDVAAQLPCRVIRRRRVAWSTTAFETLEARGLACELEALRSLARHRLARSTRVRFGDVSDCDVRVGTRRTEMHPAAMRAGRRIALEAHVEGIALEDDMTVVAAVSAGWTFIAPHPKRGASVTVVVPSELDGTRTPARAIQDALVEVDATYHEACIGSVSVSACAPTFDPTCGDPRWLSVGDAALAVDPLRGDGVGYAARGAVLLAVALGPSSTPAAERLRHYQGRLGNAFRAHLTSCLDLYAAARNADIWAHDITETARCQRAMGPAVALSHRLERV